MLSEMFEYFDGAAEDEYDVCRRCHQVKPVDEHHLVKRSQGGDRVIKVCRECHRWIEENPLDAEKEGFNIKPWNKKDAEEKGTPESR